jgi:hypothetical protein
VHQNDDRPLLQVKIQTRPPNDQPIQPEPIDRPFKSRPLPTPKSWLHRKTCFSCAASLPTLIFSIFIHPHEDLSLSLSLSLPPSLSLSLSPSPSLSLSLSLSLSISLSHSLPLFLSLSLSLTKIIRESGNECMYRSHSELSQHYFTGFFQVFQMVKVEHIFSVFISKNQKYSHLVTLCGRQLQCVSWLLLPLLLSLTGRD